MALLSSFSKSPVEQSCEPTITCITSSSGQQENLIWGIVAAGGSNGVPEVGDREYHIIGVQSGLMLCAACMWSRINSQNFLTA